MIPHGKEIKVFTGSSNPDLADMICKNLGISLGKSTVTAFADGECSISINEPVRGVDVFIVQSTCKPVNDSLMELLVMIDAMKRASAGRITAVIPYFGYARQDRKAKSRDPISAKLVANMLVAAGVDRVLTMDLHANQIQGFFDIPVDNMRGAPLFADYYLQKFGKGNPDVMVVSPDVGGVARARETALERARGRYVTFLDGDDLFEPEMLQRLVDEIERSACDVVCCDYKRISSSYEAPVRAGRTGEMSGLEFLEALLCNEVWGGLWGKLYRRSLFDGTIRHYPLRLWQDSAVNIQLFSRNPRVRFIDYVGYGYVQRAGSSNHSRLDFDYCRLYCETVSAELRRRDAELAGRADYLATLSTLRVYLTYFCKSRNPWAGDSDLARNLRRDVARYRREVRRHYSAARLALLDLDRWHALRPLVVLIVTLLRWRKSLERRLSR